MDFLLQLAIVLVCLFYGARKGGIALGLLGGIGMVVMTYVFRLKPGTPPVDVMLTIIAVVAASATLQASGGLDVLLQFAERLLRRTPKFITILAPFTTCGLTMLCGTGHVVYTMMPIIYDIAIKNNIRPERPMAGASIASQMGIIASPVSVAVVSLVAFLPTRRSPATWSISSSSLHHDPRRSPACWRSASSAGFAARISTRTRIPGVHRHAGEPRTSTARTPRCSARSSCQ